ncbi:hypothetical protein ACFLQ4_01940 [Bacteroidota bacterium]
MRPLKAIRQYCLDCSNGSPKEVKLCQIEDCPLYKFRFGKNPNRKGIGGQGFPKTFVQKSLAESGSFGNKERLEC